jgi:hypothetical protein
VVAVVAAELMHQFMVLVAAVEPQLLALSHSLPELIPYLLVVEAVQDHPTSQVQEVVRPEQMEAAQAEMPVAAVLLVEAEVVEVGLESEIATEIFYLWPAAVQVAAAQTKVLQMMWQPLAAAFKITAPMAPIVPALTDPHIAAMAVAGVVVAVDIMAVQDKTLQVAQAVEVEIIIQEQIHHQQMEIPVA